MDQEPSVYKVEVVCTKNSIEFSYITQYKNGLLS